MQLVNQYGNRETEDGNEAADKATNVACELNQAAAPIDHDMAKARNRATTIEQWHAAIAGSVVSKALKWPEFCRATPCCSPNTGTGLESTIHWHVGCVAKASRWSTSWCRAQHSQMFTSPCLDATRRHCKKRSADGRQIVEYLRRLGRL